MNFNAWEVVLACVAVIVATLVLRHFIEHASERIVPSITRPWANVATRISLWLGVYLLVFGAFELWNGWMGTD